ncbi:hypothetical protein [Candidatus Foliamicus sp.]
MTAGEQAPRLRRTAKGKRPRYFSDPAIDRLLGMMMTLIGEVSVLRDRLDSVERLIEKGGVFKREDIDAFVPDADAEAEREETRKRYIQRVMRVVQNEMEEKTPVANMPPVAEVHREFEEGKL